MMYAMSDTPVISVIIPCFNYGALLPETVQSVQSQTFTNWECIIVNDGSTDTTAEVAESLAACDPRIRLVQQKNAGPSVARNMGLRVARGQYLQFLDADDLLQPRKWERQAAYLDAHPEVAVVYGSAQYFSSAEKGGGNALLASQEMYDSPRFEKLSKDILRALTTRNHLVVNAPLVRRSIAKQIGGFDPALRTMEDWDYWLRMLLASATFKYQDWAQAHALVRIHPASASQDQRRMVRGMLAVRQKLEPLLPTDELRALSRRMEHLERAALAKQNVMHGEFMAGVRGLMTATRETGNIKWLLYAVLLPIVVQYPLRSLLPPTMALLARLRRLRQNDASCKLE